MLVKIKPIDKTNIVSYEKDIIEVHKLSHDSYVDVGYIQQQLDGFLKLNSEFDSLNETTILMAIVDKQIVGTCSYTIDSPNLLPIDKDYEYEVNLIRKLNIMPLVCCWRLAAKKEFPYRNKIIMQLMRELAMSFMIQKDGPLLLAEFNPKHYSFYNKVWGFLEISSKDSTNGLNNAPSILAATTPNSYIKALFKHRIV